MDILYNRLGAWTVKHVSNVKRKTETTIVVLSTSGVIALLRCYTLLLATLSDSSCSIVAVALSADCCQ